MQDFYHWFGSIQALDDLDELTEIDQIQRRHRELSQEIGL